MLNMIYVLFLNKTENVIKKEQVPGKKGITEPLKTVFSTQHSTLSLAESQFIFLKCNRLIRGLRDKFIQKKFTEYFFLSFSNLIFSLLNAGVRYLLCLFRDFSLIFVFFKTFEVIASPLNLSRAKMVL